MSQATYKYDVAFSFLAKDETVASQISALVQGRLQTFIFSERQIELAGTDGEQRLNQVFGLEARIVVVLYREGWGETPWTRIEQTAIRNRAYEKGYEFVVFIPLDPRPSVPVWLPKTQLWYGFDRWGIEGAASVVEARVQESGGIIHEPSAQEEATRLALEVQW